MKVTYDDARHEYRFDGALVPSVTQIIKPITGLDSVPQQFVDVARMRGTFTHQCIEYLLDGSLDEDSVHDSLRPMLDAFKMWIAHARPERCDTERLVWHGPMRYAGRADLICMIGGDGWLIDIKTTKDVHAHHGPQTAAYCKALECMGLAVSRRGCLYLGLDGSWSLVEHTDADDWRCFVALHTLHNWMTNAQRRGSMKGLGK